MAIPEAVATLIDGRALMAHLATSADDRPHVAPVWYAIEDGRVWVLTGGRKLANVRRNPRVALSVEEHTDGRAEWTVTLLGTATVVEDRKRRREAARRIFPTYLGPDRDQWDPYYRSAVEDAPDGRLLDIDVGSATSQRY